MTILDQAIVFAVKAHEGQQRKLTNIPAILHSLEVSTLIATLTSDLNTAAAGVLHDTVEDGGISPQTIRAQFGDRVADLVASETESRDSRPAAETWYERKKTSLDVLRATDDREVKILWLCDKLSNLRSFYREYRKIGDAVWSYLNQHDPAMHAWYYRTVGSCVSELAGTDAYKEYMTLTEKLFSKGEDSHAASKA